jgi:uncharacterized membrane protein
MVSGLALGPVIMAVAQVLKPILRKLNLLKDGQTAWLVLILSILAVLVALFAGFFEVEAQAAEIATAVQTFASVIFSLLTSFGYFEIGKKVQLIKQPLPAGDGS